MHIRSAPSFRRGWGQASAGPEPEPAEGGKGAVEPPASLSSCTLHLTWQVRATTCRAGGGCPLWNSAAAGHQGQATATPPASERACAHGTTASVFNKTLCRLASDSHEVLLLNVGCSPAILRTHGRALSFRAKTQECGGD